MRKHQVESEFVPNNSDRGSTVMEERSDSLVEYSFFPSAMSESSGSFSCIWNGTNPNSPIYIPSIFPANHSDSETTQNFSEDHKIGTGSFSSVYRATLDDGQVVAIKRAQLSMSTPYVTKLKDNKNATKNEYEDLSCLNHKNLVRLLGFCKDRNVRVVVYEYMENGTLHDHLHKLQSTPLISWAARIKVALDAAKGIICSTANRSVDPEYHKLHLLTPKSDVYSFGVVLLEILSGYKALHRDENGEPQSIVDFVVPYIAQDEIHKILDPKIPPPTPFELAAVAYVGNLALHCASLEGRNRPSMTEIVRSLQRALDALQSKTFGSGKED
uniref:Protein kinase domain-containing protein n=1 Tax=Quercus lobata TaxID=97700 RepID=A0A7N2LLT4_QUELO